VRPSPEEVSALVASIGKIPDDERQVHFEVPLNPSDAEISAMLDMLAEDSSNAAPTETLAVAPIPEAGKALDIQRSDSVRPKRPRWANQPTSPAEGKKNKKKRLRRVSCLDQDAGPSAPAARDVPVPVFAEADPNGCTVRIIDEDEEEENEVPLIQKNSRRYIASGESSGVPSPALSALVGLQELSLANFDETLEDMVPEDLLSERQMVGWWIFMLMCLMPGWSYPERRPMPHRPWSVVLRVRRLVWIVLLPWKWVKVLQP
jgi:hypothetical protein